MLAIVEWLRLFTRVSHNRNGIPETALGMLVYFNPTKLRIDREIRISPNFTLLQNQNYTVFDLKSFMMIDICIM